MQLHHISIPFDRLAHPTDQQLQLVGEQLLFILGPEQSARGHITIYGMGPAGQCIYHYLTNKFPSATILAYDQRGPNACADIPVLPVSELRPDSPEKTQPDLIINTTPPAYVLRTTALLEWSAPQAPQLLWHDPFGYVERAHDGYSLYFSALKPQPSEQTNLLAQAIEAHYLSSVTMQLQQAAADVMPLGALASLLEENQCDLGTYLDRRLSEILQADRGQVTSADQLSEKIFELTTLNHQFPFFTIALDAASCLLVQNGDYEQAISVFSPAAERYPHCHRTLAKLAELYLMAGDREQARRLSNRAIPLVSANSLMRAEYEELSEQPTELIISKWQSRLLRPPRNKRKVSLHCAVPVWGKTFIDLFMRVTLRSLLAPGNLPFAASHTKVLFTIYTDVEGATLLQGYPEWQLLTELVEVQLQMLAPILAQSAKSGTNRYNRLSLSQDHALQVSQRKGMVTFFPLADLLFSAEFLKQGLKLLDEGYDTIFFAGMRYSKERILEEVVPHFSRGLRIVAPAMQLFAYAARAVHPIYATKIQNDHVEMHPNSYFSTTLDGNILQHFFASTPIFVAPVSRPVSIESTLDSDLGFSVTDGGLGNFYYIDDTSKMLLLELTSETADTGEEQIKGAPSEAACANWLRHTIDPVNKLLGARTVVLRQKQGLKQTTEALQLAQAVYRLLM